MLYKYCLDPWLSPSAPAPAPVRSRSLQLQLKLHRLHLLSQVKNHVVIVANLQSWALHSFQKNVPFFLFFSVLYKSTIRSFRSFPFKKENVPFFSVSVRKRTKRTERSFEKNGCPTLPNCILLEESEHQLTTKKGGGN